ncbi:Otopetrin [Homalodisca vitripennis]|nr:Otopetrin [Homalodisca vitripennis]
MLGGGEVKVATVEAVESVDNMATLPVSRAHGGSDITPEKNNFTNKEMEAKKRPVGAVPMQPKRTSLFIVLSFIYAKLLVVVCIAFVVSEVVTHSLPIPYYEPTLPPYNRQRDKAMFTGYLGEYLYRKMIRDSSDKFLRFVNDIATLYEPATTD